MSDHSATVGEHSLIVGSITGEEDLYVSGSIEGTIQLTETLFVETTGIIKADVTARRAVIAGEVAGDLEIAELLTVDAEATLNSSVRAGAVVINGTVRGSVAAAEYVELAPGGVLIGDVSSARLIMADGATLRGNVTMAGLEHEALPEAVTSTQSQPEARGRSRRQASTDARRTSSYARPSRNEPSRRPGSLQAAPSRFTSRTTTTVVETDDDSSPIARLRASAPPRVDPAATLEATTNAATPKPEPAPTSSTAQSVSSDHAPLLSPEEFAELGWNKGRSYLKTHDINLQYSGREDMLTAYTDFLKMRAG